MHNLPKFPFKKFGPCPVCGGVGPDDPDASGADVAVDRTNAVVRENAANVAGVDISDDNGYPLFWYQGELMCKMCIKEKEANAESLIVSEKHAEAEEFRAKAGFVTEVS